MFSVRKWHIPAFLRGSSSDSKQASTSFRFLAQRIGSDLPVGETGRVITMSSLVPAEVAADMVLSLAWYLADELGGQVLVIDGSFGPLDLSSPAGVVGGNGLTERLADGAAVAESLHRLAGNVMFLAAGGELHEGAGEISQSTAKFLDKVRKDFAYTLVAQGPIEQDTRYLAFAAESDLVLMMAEEGRSRLTELESSQGVYAQHGITNVRSVLTSPTRSASRLLPRQLPG